MYIYEHSWNSSNLHQPVEVSLKIGGIEIIVNFNCGKIFFTGQQEFVIVEN